MVCYELSNCKSIGKFKKSFRKIKRKTRNRIIIGKMNNTRRENRIKCAAKWPGQSEWKRGGEKKWKWNKIWYNGGRQKMSRFQIAVTCGEPMYNWPRFKCGFLEHNYRQTLWSGWIRGWVEQPKQHRREKQITSVAFCCFWFQFFCFSFFYLRATVVCMSQKAAAYSFLYSTHKKSNNFLVKVSEF